MKKEERYLKEIIHAEASNDKTFDLPESFTGEVMNIVEYKIFRRSQMRKITIIIGILSFFLLSILTLYYFDGLYNLHEKINARPLLSIWKYKFVPVSLLSFSILLSIDLIRKMSLRQDALDN